MKNCEAENAEMLANLSTIINTTLGQLNLTGLSTLQVQTLKDDVTKNITGGLRECNKEKFLTEVSGKKTSEDDSPWNTR